MARTKWRRRASAQAKGESVPGGRKGESLGQLLTQRSSMAGPRVWVRGQQQDPNYEGTCKSHAKHLERGRELKQG